MWGAQTQFRLVTGRFGARPPARVEFAHPTADNSFPSDHASVAFAVAFAVLAFHRRFGLVLLLGAAAVAIDRIFVGVHYPVDVTASLFVGLGSALAVTTVGRPYVSWGVRQLSRLSDPVVASARGRIAPTRSS